VTRKLAQARMDFDWPIFSADDAMMVDGVYRFRPENLGLAHRQCLRGFAGALQNSILFVDNTNSTVMEAAPYIALALAHEHEVVIHVFRVDPAVAHARNTHGVPLHAVQRMAESIDREWPASLPWHWRPGNEPAISIVEEGMPR
jgi:hypothetical protein